MSNLKLRPETIALLDQANAATAHAAGVLKAIADHDGTKVRYDTLPGPVLHAITRKLSHRLLSSQMGLCDHLSWTAPQPAIWLPWAPGKLRCIHCAAAAARRIRGTREDNLCDGCGKYSSRIHCDTAQTPALVAELPPHPPGCFPPLLVQYGLCPACQKADLQQQATTPPE